MLLLSIFIEKNSIAFMKLAKQETDRGWTIQRELLLDTKLPKMFNLVKISTYRTTSDTNVTTKVSSCRPYIMGNIKLLLKH